VRAPHQESPDLPPPAGAGVDPEALHTTGGKSQKAMMMAGWGTICPVVVYIRSAVHPSDVGVVPILREGIGGEVFLRNFTLSHS